MNTEYKNPIQNIIHVWTDENGGRFAAELIAPYIVGFCEYETGSNGVIPENPETADALHALVNGRFYAKAWNRDALSRIESRELSQAARNQDPTPARSLSDAISYPERCPIDATTLDAIIALLGYRCRAETCRTIRHRLQSPTTLRNYGIYDRLQISPTVSYCAGQDYPGELATIRKLLIENR